MEESWADKFDGDSHSRSGSRAVSRKSGAVVLEDNPDGAELDFEDPNLRKGSATPKSAQSTKNKETPKPSSRAAGDERSTSKVQNLIRQRQSAQSKKSAKSPTKDDENFGSEGDNASGKGGTEEGDRPESSRSKVSFAAIVLQAKPGIGKKKEDEIEIDEDLQPKKKKPPSKAAKLCKRFFKWFRLLVQLLIISGVAVLCIISAVLSFMKFIESSGQPASKYKPKKMSGPHDAPGLIFIGVDLSLESCELFNFTALNIESLDKNESCDPGLTIELLPSDSLNADELSSLPNFLTEEKQSGSTLQMHLVRGPSLWMYKHTSYVHLTIPKTDTGTWGILYSTYDDARTLFDAAINAEDDGPRWKLAGDLILGNSMNFVTTDYQTVFLMSRQDFMELGISQATRVDMEISLLGMDKDALNGKIGQVEGENATRAHMQALFQWKDGYIMQGDTFMATSPFQIVTVISGVLLMLERAYNTFMRLYNSAKKKKPKEEAGEGEEQAAAERKGKDANDISNQDNSEVNKSTDDNVNNMMDDDLDKPGSRMQTPLIKVDEPDIDEEFGQNEQEQNFGYIAPGQQVNGH